MKVFTLLLESVIIYQKEIVSENKHNSDINLRQKMDLTISINNRYSYEN